MDEYTIDDFLNDMTDWCAKCGEEHTYMCGPCEKCGSKYFTKERPRNEPESTAITTDD